MSIPGRCLDVLLFSSAIQTWTVWNAWNSMVGGENDKANIHGKSCEHQRWVCVCVCVCVCTHCAILFFFLEWIRCPMYFLFLITLPVWCLISVQLHIRHLSRLYLFFHSPGNNFFETHEFFGRRAVAIYFMRFVYCNRTNFLDYRNKKKTLPPFLNRNVFFSKAITAQLHWRFSLSLLSQAKRIERALLLLRSDGVFYWLCCEAKSKCMTLRDVPNITPTHDTTTT